MPNNTLFQSKRLQAIPPVDTVNKAGGPAYAFSSKHALAQYVATGCFNQTYYAEAQEQLDKVLELAFSVDPLFVAQTAVFARTRGQMKDAPALLCAALTGLGPELLQRIFPRVIDDGKMLRNFVQMIRSGVVGRKSLGTAPKRLVRNWFASQTDEQLFRNSVGQKPSMGDVIKMVHPKPNTEAREALYGYLCGRKVALSKLPKLVQQFEAFKAHQGEMPDVPFQMLTSLQLGDKEWAEIARTAGWTMTRMNLNTFARHGVFNDKSRIRLIAERLRSPDLVRQARGFPYPLMTAYNSTGDDVPHEVREALQDAMEHALYNVPQIDGKVYVLVDVSGSMLSPVTGHRAGSTTAVRCIDVAALFASALLRVNRHAEVMPFAEAVRSVRLNPRDSVMTTATRLAQMGGGGTNCSAPLEKLNERKARGDLVVFISDNESWMDVNRGRGVQTLYEWEVFRKRNTKAKLCCIDIQPNSNSQAKERNDILNVGGFSDQVFETVGNFAAGKISPEHWVGVIESIEI